jgi:hypothetical protein
VSASMKLQWPDTILSDREPYTWIEGNLFPEDFLDPVAFASTEVLYRCAIPGPLLELVVFGRPRPASFSPADLNDAISAACRADDIEPSAFWWSVNVHDNCARVVERVGIYSFADPLEPLLIQLAYNPAVEGGTSYAGLLDRRHRWALSLESGTDFVIALHGSAAFCRRVASAVGEASRA